MPKKAVPSYIDQFEKRVEGLAHCYGMSIDEIRRVADTILGLINSQRKMMGMADEYRLFLLLDTNPKAKIGFWNFCLVSERCRSQWLRLAFRKIHPSRKEVA